MVKSSETPPIIVLCHPSAHSDHPNNPCGYRDAATAVQHQHTGQRIPNTGMLVLPSTEQTWAHIQQGRCTLWHLLWSICLPGHCSTSLGIFLPFGVNMQLYKQVPTPPFLTLIFRRYYTLIGLRMSYLDSGGGKRELAGEQRNIKRVLIRQA